MSCSQFGPRCKKIIEIVNDLWFIISGKLIFYILRRFTRRQEIKCEAQVKTYIILAYWYWQGYEQGDKDFSNSVTFSFHKSLPTSMLAVHILQALKSETPLDHCDSFMQYVLCGCVRVHCIVHLLVPSLGYWLGNLRLLCSYLWEEDVLIQ